MAVFEIEEVYEYDKKSMAKGGYGTDEVPHTGLGLTHHMFGRDHAGVGADYGPYDARRLLGELEKELTMR